MSQETEHRPEESFDLGTRLTVLSRRAIKLRSLTPHAAPLRQFPDVRSFLANLHGLAFYVAVGLLCLLAGAMTAAEPLAVPALVGFVAVFRSPALSVVAVLVLGTIFGNTGAHWLVPWVDLPLFEVVLVWGAVAAIARILTGRAAVNLTHATFFFMWLPAAAWGLCLFLFMNDGDSVSGAREAILFAYPALMLLPLIADPGFLRLIEGRTPWVLASALGIAVATVGAWHFLNGSTTPTSTPGALRTIGSPGAPALAAGVFAGLWWIANSRRPAVPVALTLASGAGFLFVNHRSAYLGLIVSVVVFAWARPRTGEGRRTRSLTRPAIALVLASAVILIATPLGRAGIDRIAATSDQDDPNVTFRIKDAERTLEKASLGEAIFGSGVGLQQTDLAAPDPDRDEPHNSFVSMFERGGVVGLMLMLVPIIYGYRLMIANRGSMAIRCLLTVTTFTIIMACFNVVMENSYFGIWVWVSLFTGTLLAIKRKEEREQEPRTNGMITTR